MIASIASRPQYPYLSGEANPRSSRPGKADDRQIHLAGRRNAAHCSELDRGRQDQNAPEREPGPGQDQFRRIARSSAPLRYSMSATKCWSDARHARQHQDILLLRQPHDRRMPRVVKCQAVNSRLIPQLAPCAAKTARVGSASGNACISLKPSAESGNLR